MRTISFFRREFPAICDSNVRIVNTFPQRANSVVLERITQYNNRDVKARRRKEAPQWRSKPASRPASRQSRCNRRIIESAHSRALRTHTLRACAHFIFLPLLVSIPFSFTDFSSSRPFLPLISCPAFSDPLFISASSYRHKCSRRLHS